MASLRPASTRLCSSCLRLYTPIPFSRSFTSSPRRRPPSLTPGHLPTFQPTSSPALNDLLSTFRNNVFLPAQLSPHQRNLIYRTKNHHLLKGEEPATAMIGSEVVQMVPLNRFRDEPGTNSSLAKVLDLMDEAGGDAWQNLPEFLMGLKSSKRKLTGNQIEKIARRACQAKQEGLVKQCCLRPNDTGLAFWQIGVVRELMWAAFRRAHDGGWEGDGLKGGLKFAEDLWILLQDPWDRKLKRNPSINAMHRPEIVGVMVQLHAAKLASLGKGEDETKNLKKYVKILLAIWDNAELGLPKDSNDANHKLLMWTPVWYGMRTARQLLSNDHEMRHELGMKLAHEIEPVLQHARDLELARPPQEGIRRGAKLYDALSNFSR
ncbi:hypothetical protein MMC07_006510 [Pseudocyphellaria aurata]|nr:hypothetical protein [Pseudocyphellaria aurata]